MASRLISDLHPDMQPLCQRFLDNCAHAGIKVGLSCTYRSNDEQNKDYGQGREVPGKIITNAKAGQSPHNVTLADGTPAACGFDFFVYNDNGKTADWDASDEKWHTVIKIGENLGLVSGAEWHGIKDIDHMELPAWKNYVSINTTT